MTLQEAVKLLESHNKWRRGDDTLEMAEPKDLGKAIDLIVKHFKTKREGMFADICNHTLPKII